MRRGRVSSPAFTNFPLREAPAGGMIVSIGREGYDPSFVL